MTFGLRAAVFWAVETMLLNAAMSHGYLSQINPFHASLIAAALHDLLSACYVFAYLSKKSMRRYIVPAFCSAGGRRVMIAALLGGPAGMTCYLLAIQNAGASMATSVSALYPAIGAFFAFLFLKERLHGYQIAGLLLSVCGTVLLGAKAGESHSMAGFLFAVLCALSWGSEAVVSSYGMKLSGISSEIALQLRQIISAAAYLLVLCPVFGVLSMAPRTVRSSSFGILLAAALFGTISYLFYYKAIRRIGPSKAMALNITYTVWVIVFESILQRAMPDIRSILCAVFISGGSALAALERKNNVKIIKRS